MTRLIERVLLPGLAAALIAAPAADDLDLTWRTIDAGGATLTAGDLALSGTVGQPDAGPPLTGGGWTLTGGFWPGAASPVDTCPGDVDASGIVDFDDLLAVLGAWGLCEACPEDLNDDGFVDFADLLIVLSAWGPCP